MCFILCLSFLLVSRAPRKVSSSSSSTGKVKELDDINLPPSYYSWRKGKRKAWKEGEKVENGMTLCTEVFDVISINTMYSTSI